MSCAPNFLKRNTVALIALLMVPLVNAEGILYPIESESRSVQLLDGIWNFRLCNKTDSFIGHREGWYKGLKKTGATIPMPVPSSYNDITQDKAVRDHLGVVWYDRTFYVPVGWKSSATKVWLRFGSVHYEAHVYVNSELVTSHAGGHVPFQCEVTSALKYGEENLISVAVNNTLTDVTVPQGGFDNITTDSGAEIIQTYKFDFFNYAGIHRPVVLYTTPSIYIDDISVDTRIHGETGVIEYSVSVEGHSSGNSTVLVSLVDRDGNYVIRDVAGSQGELQVPEARLWWPYLMDSDPGYLYTLEIRLHAVGDISEDVYRLSVGIRKVEWNNTSVTINGKPIYIRGFGRHEDSAIRGKGHDFPLIARDYNLIKWLGANAYRTSHYPYSEEIMNFADREGIMIIDECPGVDIGSYGFNDELLENHKMALTRLYNRDKNRPSVIMWSVANEARTSESKAEDYFRDIANHTKSLDSSRPITMAINAAYTEDVAGTFMDVIGFNRYNAWYAHGGRTDTVTVNVREEAQNWHDKYKKPVLMTEYGADTLAGLHLSPEYIWSEEYQVKVMSRHFAAFDQLRSKNFFIGEMIWNFADFNTEQTYTRAGGNKKGIFTRDRQPKAAAHFIRKRYWALAEELDSAAVPDDVNEYTHERPFYVIQAAPESFQAEDVSVICV
ncbi:beta-glucuronidase-like [Periplaneta americana]|uniref:beta-glucuronidase-like n=1 Tax=Periplaneta americana TaxID=6978 RepID=UPI0037E8372D